MKKNKALQEIVVLQTQFDGVIVDDGFDATALRQLSEQDLIRQRLLDLFVNQPGHWPCAVACVKAMDREPFAGLFA